MRACVRVCAAVVVIVSVGVVVGARVGACVEDVVVESWMSKFLCPGGGGAEGAPAAVGVVACTCTDELPGGASEEACNTKSIELLLGTALSKGGVPA